MSNLPPNFWPINDSTKIRFFHRLIIETIYLTSNDLRGTDRYWSEHETWNNLKQDSLIEEYAPSAVSELPVNQKGRVIDTLYGGQVQQSSTAAGSFEVGFR